MSTKLIIPGQREAVPSSAARGASAGGVPVQPVTNLLDAVEVVDAFNLSAPARAIVPLRQWSSRRTTTTSSRWRSRVALRSGPLRSAIARTLRC